MKFFIAIACLMASIAQAQVDQTTDAKQETPLACKARTGTERACFTNFVNSVIIIAEATNETLQLEMRLGRFDSAAKLRTQGKDAKVNVRPYYDALMASLAEKPEALAASKKAMAAFLSVVNSLPGNVGLRNNLKIALSELEVEVP